ncbi:Protein SDA1 -like protein [Halotydeus destructor]|nr:Protein SDA1 -like protein [Halotydeus destructor]
MSKRTSNQLPNNLPQLQNCIKRDPDSYKEEFLQQYRHYEALTQVFQYSPENKDKDFEDLVMFLSQISHCYQEELLEFPNDLMNLLRLYATVLHHDVRLCMCKALILLRTRVC